MQWSKTVKRALRNIIRKNIKRFFLFVVGTIFIVLGFLGSVLPILPGIYFFIFGIGMYLRAFPFLFHILRILRFEKSLMRPLPRKLKISIIVSTWLSFLLPPLLLFAFKYGGDLHIFLSSVTLRGFLFSLVFPLFITFYVATLKNLAEIFGYRPNPHQNPHQHNRKQKI